MKHTSVQLLIARLAMLAVAAIVPANAGCGGDARVDLAAADALSATADNLDTAFAEYHRDVAAADDGREDEVLAAFVVRVQADHADPEAVQKHTGEFKAAMKGIREDRDTEHLRLANARDSIAALREISKGLTTIGINSLTLRDDVRRYFTSWIEAKKRADSGAASPASSQ